jgi:hypothetical protein
MAFFGQPVSLFAASRLVRDGHLDETGFEGRTQVFGSKMLSIRNADAFL